MTKEQIKRIHLIYGSLVGIVTVIAGICFIVACVGIYHSGDQPYSREAVAAAFSPISVPVYLCLALVIGGFILSLALPLEKGKTKAEKNEELILARLSAKADFDKCEETVPISVQTEQKKRRLHTLISAVLLVICSVIFLIYALNGNHFHKELINESMIDAMKLLVPCLLIPFAYTVFAIYYKKKSIHRELELVKQAIAGGAKKETAAKEANQSADQPPVRRVHLLRLMIVVVGIVLMIIGIATGGVADVLAKAINICTECIGLG